MARLILQKGEHSLLEFPLRGAHVAVGRSDTCDLVVPSVEVSRTHFMMRASEHGWTLVDRSRHGTRINGSFVQSPTPLSHGQRIELANYTLLYVDEPPETEERTCTDAGTHDQQPAGPLSCFGSMVGRSESSQRIFESLRRMAAHDATILLVGESGTGKELAARGVHDASPRQPGPFIAVNCGGLAEGLVESELFGHEKGAFTSAHRRRKGAFEQADGGTLFLDEIGELPLPAQAKLLRVLESGEVRPVGCDDTLHPSVRVVAATNRNLFEEMEQGRFRADLFFRLAVLMVRIPPLRERMEDLAPAAEAIGSEIGDALEISRAAMDVLATHDFPGNFRELRNVLTRAFVLGGSNIQPESLVLSPWEKATPSTAPPSAARTRLANAERRMIIDSLKRHRGNRSAVARELGMARSTLHYKLQRHQIQPTQSQS
ncbi:MAG: sigma 54-interacting transcriptional regulator [Myxococcota bacterium]|nr:sigma 54-interacting transcriptional regulator [Myxococcota bacterium]